MSNQGAANGGESIPWRRFLVAQPPGQVKMVTGLATGDPLLGSLWLSVPSIEIYCDSEKCGGIRFFDPKTETRQIHTTDWFDVFLSYACRHCHGTMKIYAIRARLHNKTGHNGEAVKIGELPSFGPHVPTKVFSLVGPDQELFLKGRRAESQGMGIAAFGYYRRVVENQKNRLIDEIIKVSKLLNAPEQTIKRLEEARNETQFHKAVQIVKDGIPDALRISGHNPLTLLHTALSDGLHDRSDEECLVRAISIRSVLAELADRIVNALKEDAELKAAVSNLLQIQSGIPKQKPVTATPAPQTSAPPLGGKPKA